MSDDLGRLDAAIAKRIDDATRPLRARIHAIEAQLLPCQLTTSAIAAVISDLLLHYDAAAAGELSEEELKAAIGLVVRKWNRAGKANGINGAHVNGAGSNGAHLS